METLIYWQPVLCGLALSIERGACGSGRKQQLSSVGFCFNPMFKWCGFSDTHTQPQSDAQREHRFNVTNSRRLTQFPVDIHSDYIPGYTTSAQCHMATAKTYADAFACEGYTTASERCLIWKSVCVACFVFKASASNGQTKVSVDSSLERWLSKWWLHLCFRVYIHSFMSLTFK